MGIKSRVIKAVDSDGVPVVNALIAVETSDVPFPEISLITDKNGVVSLALPDGHYRIGARSLEGAYGAVELGVADNTEPDEIVIVVQEAENLLE